VPRAREQTSTRRFHNDNTTQPHPAARTDKHPAGGSNPREGNQPRVTSPYKDRRRPTERREAETRLPKSLFGEFGNPEPQTPKTSPDRANQDGRSEPRPDPTDRPTERPTDPPRVNLPCRWAPQRAGRGRRRIHLCSLRRPRRRPRRQPAVSAAARACRLLRRRPKPSPGPPMGPRTSTKDSAEILAT
jgi:hypothetical protein